MTIPQQAKGLVTDETNSNTATNASPQNQFDDSKNILNHNDDHNKKPDLLDPVTALQDTIDSFSLSLFEALRSLRDAVAPDTSNSSFSDSNNDSAPEQINTVHDTNSNPNTHHLSDTDGDYNDFKTLIKMKDPHTLKILGTRSMPKNREQYAQMLLDMEREQDMELVSTLANQVLEKSDKVDALVRTLPGMDRTKEEQMKIMDNLIRENWDAVNELELEYKKAQEMREEVRDLLQQMTCQTLGIEEEA